MLSNQRIEFGDFQTPEKLAEKVCRLLHDRGIRPRTVIEPTCGQGAFLIAAVRRFSNLDRIVGSDINSSHLNAAQRKLCPITTPARHELFQADFFDVDWPAQFDRWTEPLLVLGNPPWVCNSELGIIGGKNLPKKRNAERMRGIEALTGKSNFDISLWMLNRLTEALSGRNATLAMLCKTSVARKALRHAWKSDLQTSSAAVFEIDASNDFGVSVDACLFVIQFRSREPSRQCDLFARITDRRPRQQIGFCDGRVISHLRHYRQWKHLGGSSKHRWRSGIKHDCAKVMELRREGSGYRNGLGDVVDIEDTLLFPLLKSSHLAKGFDVPERWMLVPQQSVGQETDSIRTRAPKTWDYLQTHASRLDVRASRVYRNQPRFSIFGVGEYAFASWKIAISGFYKRLEFRKLGRVGHKPIVLDDTCYLLPCESEQRADELFAALNSDIALEYLSSQIFWDSKRPITSEILNTLDLDRLLKEIGSEASRRP